MSIVVDDANADESRPFAQFTFHPHEPSTLPASGSDDGGDGTSAGGGDGTGSPGLWAFTPAQPASTTDVPRVASAIQGADGTFDFDLFNPVKPAVGMPLARAAIHASGAAPLAVTSPLITVSDAVADESNTFLQFVVSLSGASTQSVSVSFNSSNVTAANGSDYTAKSGTLTFAPGETTKVVQIAVLDTAGAEPAETMALNLFSAVNATIGRPLAYGTIVDNDQASGTPLVRVGDQVVDEASGQVSFVVTLDKPSAGNVSVNYATANGTALAGSDYVAQATHTLTFAPGEMVKVVNVALIDDGTVEGREYFDLQLSSAVGATLLPHAAGRAAIGANDATAVSLPLITVSDAVADESNTYLEFVVSLNAPSTQAVSVSYNNSNVTAFNGSDYVAQASTLTFAAGETTKVVKIPVLDTVGAEPTAVMALNLFSAANATIGRPLAYGTIYDNDLASGTPLIRVGDQVVDEASGQVSFVVTLDKPSTGNVSVTYATVNGTALAGSDYVAQATQTLTFTPGEVVKVVNVALINDGSVEGREYFDLQLSSPVGATLLPHPTGRATIGGNDATAVSLPLITVSDAVADESNTYLEFVVSLNAPSTQAVSVSYNNSNVTAFNGSDYVAQASTLTFAAGETTKVVKIPVLDTAGTEPTAVMALNLFSAVNATIGRPLAYGTIYDNDQASGTPLIRVGDQVVDEASGQVSFVVTLDKPSTGNVSVTYATVDGTALAGSDYVAKGTQTLTFTPGEMVKVVNVALINDGSTEGREYFDLQLSSPVGATLLPHPVGRVAIGANDATAVSLPLITVSDAVADESNTYLEFVVSLNAPSTQAVSVSYNNSNVTALNGSDYVAQASTLTFAAGETTKVVKIPVLDTAGIESTAVMALNLFSAVNATIGRPLAYGTIHDNDQTSGTPVLHVGDQVVDEASGQVSFVITLDKPSTGNVSVNYATVNGTALAGSDYLAQATQTLTFTPGEMTKVVTVDLINDATVEAGEYLDLRLSSPVGATLPDANARVFIGPSDATAASLPRIVVSDATADEAGTYLEFVVSLSAPSTQSVQVSYNDSNVTAANGSDYVAQASTLTFAPGETTKVVKIPVLDGLTVEPTEYMTLNLSSAVNATIAQPRAYGTILDNDALSGTPRLVVSDGIVDESGARAAFVVTLDKPSTSQVTVSYATANAVASSGSDYESQAAQTLVFAPGEMSKTVYVDLRGDTVAEPAEFFDLTLSGAVNATIGDSRGHMVIPRSDATTVAAPVIDAAAIASPEGGGTLDFVVTLNAPSAQSVSVSYNNSNGTALNGSDYVAQASVITFAPGETVHVVHIPVIDDLAVESTETFTLNLFSAVNATIGTPSISGAILDNDGSPLRTQFVNDGTGNADILVGRAGSNAVVGGAGDDVLDGVGGVSMTGGAGNDLYIVETPTDSVIEASGAGSGTDAVASYINYTLGANVEKLVLFGGALTGTGNTLNNTLTGNASANVLDGKAGADTMAGAGGDDVYIVDNAGDVVVDGSNAGTDSVKSSVSFTLGANVENLTLAGAAAVNATGNSLNNVIVGNTAANVLNGAAGADTLSGGGGSNTFVFNYTSGGFDTVTDWHSATDTMRFGMSGLHIGNGDAVVDNAVTRGSPGGFSTAAELVVFTTDIVGAITTASAAAKIGSATSVYAVGANVLFTVDNGTQTGIFLFHSAGTDALVSAGELTEVALLNGDATTTADYVFAP
ncbi:MAG: Calx-beta domain-containing protein [Betaproteobacteria bacterium]